MPPIRVFAVIDPNAVVYPTTSFITFSILNGTSGSSVFGVTPLTGLFFPLATNLDYNIAQSYEVYVMVRHVTVRCPCSHRYADAMGNVTQASDAQGLNASAYFTIEILYVNKPPTLSNLTYTVQDIYANGGYSFSPPLNSIDPQSGSVYYWLLSGPSAVALDPYSGVISLTSALSDGSYLLTVMLNDTIGMSSMTYITISVVPVGPPSLIGIGLPPSGFAVTSGFDAITLQGSNFLPTANFTASYSNAYASFNASYCVFNSSTVVTCYTSPVSVSLPVCV